MSRFSTRLSAAIFLTTAALVGFGCSTLESGIERENPGKTESAVQLGGAAAPGQVVKTPDDDGDVPHCSGESIWLPDGSETWTEADGSIGFKVPPGYLVIEEDPVTGKPHTGGGSTTVTCTCTEGSGGCSPVAAGNSVGCYMGSGCSVCRKSVSASAIFVPSGVGFASAEDVVTLPRANGTVLEYPMVAEAFQAFKATVAADAGLGSAEDLDSDATGKLADAHTFVSAPGWELAAVNVFGRLALLSVPAGYADQMGLQRGTKQTCGCSAGSGCTSGRMLGARYCDAGNCSSCSMTLNDKVGIDEAPQCSL